MEKTFAMISLGCAKNLVNSEQMLYLLDEAGFVLVPEPEGAELAIVNTCGFIDAAKSEAIDVILEMAELKKEGKLGALIVTGCLSERYQEGLDPLRAAGDRRGFGRRQLRRYRRGRRRGYGGRSSLSLRLQQRPGGRDRACCLHRPVLGVSAHCRGL